MIIQVDRCTCRNLCGYVAGDIRNRHASRDCDCHFRFGSDRRRSADGHNDNTAAVVAGNTQPSGLAQRFTNQLGATVVIQCNCYARANFG